MQETDPLPIGYQALEAARQADIPPTAAPSPIEHAHHTTAPSIQFEHTTAIEEVRQEEPTNEADPTSPIPSSFPTQTPHVQLQDSSHPAAHHGRRSTLRGAQRDADGVSTRIVLTCAVLHESRGSPGIDLTGNRDSQSTILVDEIRPR